MSQKKLRILWPDGEGVDLILLDHELSDYYYRCVMRLKYLDLCFGPRENPLDNTNSADMLGKKLIKKFKDVGIDVNFQKLKMQEYLNELHDLYFSNFNKSKEHADEKNWLEIHDLIHLLETIETNDDDRNCIWIDYKELAGPLIKKFDRKFLKHATNTIKKGYCFFSPHELGKDLYKYWQDGEPSDLKNICRLSKPWLFLRPLLKIAIKDSIIDKKKYDNPNFLNWLKEFKEPWCMHWGLKDWDLWELSAHVPIGYIPNVDYLINRFANNDYPNKIINLQIS